MTCDWRRYGATTVALFGDGLGAQVAPTPAGTYAVRIYHGGRGMGRLDPPWAQEFPTRAEAQSAAEEFARERKARGAKAR